MAQAHASEHRNPDTYYVPPQSRWPIWASVALFIAMIGFATMLNEVRWGKTVFLLGLAFLAAIIFKWFADVITESVRGYYNKKVDSSFRQGMIWFILSEVFFFAAFFGALFYTRQFALPWLSGVGDGAMTNALLYPGYAAGWPSNGPSAIGGYFNTVGAWGLPLLNTLILLSSGVTITIAHHALKENKRGTLLLFLGLTIVLGLVFLMFQVQEYLHAWSDLNLTLGSGIYGSTFYMLTGFHGLHVTLGTLMLIVIWFRCLRGHFTPENHFGFEAVAWYWHFVDVVWLGLFLFVYVL